MGRSWREVVSQIENSHTVLYLLNGYMPYPSRPMTKYRPEEYSMSGSFSARTGSSMLAFGLRNSIYSVSHCAEVVGQGYVRLEWIGSAGEVHIGGLILRLFTR